MARLLLLKMPVQDPCLVLVEELLYETPSRTARYRWSLSIFLFLSISLALAVLPSPCVKLRFPTLLLGRGITSNQVPPSFVFERGTQRTRAMNYEVVGSKTAYDGETIKVQMDDIRYSVSSRSFNREVVVKDSFAIIMPVADDGKIACVRQFRHPFQDIELSFLSGRVVAGEDPRATAQREMDEVGLHAAELVKLGEVHEMPELARSVGHLYVAEKLTFVETTSVEAEATMEMLWLDVGELLDLVKNGQVKSVTVIAAFHHFLDFQHRRHAMDISESEAPSDLPPNLSESEPWGDFSHVDYDTAGHEDDDPWYAWHDESSEQSPQDEKTPPSEQHLEERIERPVRISATSVATKALQGDEKRIYLIRHGQGFHNLVADLYDSIGEHRLGSPYVRPELCDPPLTELGRQQAKALRSETCKLNPELLVVSPLARATQTALLAFPQVVAASSGNSSNTIIPIVAHSGCQETGGAHICDTYRDLSEIRTEFPLVDYDTTGVMEKDPLWHETKRETTQEVADRAYSFMLWLRSRPEKEIVVATHSSFLLTLLNEVVEVDNAALSKWFLTGEMRGYLVSWHDRDGSAGDVLRADRGEETLPLDDNLAQHGDSLKSESAASVAVRSSGMHAATSTDSILVVDEGDDDNDI